MSGTLGIVFDVDSLYAEFERMVDRRDRRGKRYALGTVLLLIVLAKMCGEDKPYGIAQWVSARSEELRRVLGVRRRRLPSLNTYRRVLQSAVDVKELHRVVRRFLCRKGTLSTDHSWSGIPASNTIVFLRGSPLM